MFLIRRYKKEKEEKKKYSITKNKGMHLKYGTEVLLEK